MTKKHFEAIAAIIKARHEVYEDALNNLLAAGFDEGYYSGGDDEVSTMANRLADYFASENPRFDRDHFLAACGVA